MIHRRSFITGLVSLIAAPAIVRAGSLMPVRVMVQRPPTLGEWLDEMAKAQRRYCAAVGLPYPPIRCLPPMRWRRIDEVTRFARNEFIDEALRVIDAG